MERRRSISQSYRCTRDAKERLGTPANPATDALSAISVWRALDADRSIRVLFDEGEDYLLAELTFVSGHFDDAMNDLVELCADHGFTMSCACCRLSGACGSGAGDCVQCGHAQFLGRSAAGPCNPRRCAAGTGREAGRCWWSWST
jgi:hypothetical protein